MKLFGTYTWGDPTCYTADVPEEAQKTRIFIKLDVLPFRVGFYIDVFDDKSYRIAHMEYDAFYFQRFAKVCQWLRWNRYLRLKMW